MSNTQLQRRHVLLAASIFFIAALASFSATAWIASPWLLPLLLVGNVLCLAAVARACAPDRHRTGLREDLYALSAYAIALAAYAAVVAVLVGYPLHWLHQEASLGATLALSGAVVLALLALWRLWPAFALAGNAAWQQRRERRKRDRISRSVALAWDLTADNEVFFSHGLSVAIALFALVQGGMSLAGIGLTMPTQWRLPGLAIYALVLVPVAHWVIVRRTAAALLLDRRRAHSERMHDPLPEIIHTPVDDHALDAQAAADLHATTDRTELGAMLLRCVRAGQTQLALAALAHGADPDCIPAANDRDQRSVVALAAVNPDLRLLRGLIAKGADLNRDHAGLPPLIAATRDSHEGRPDAVMTLLTNGAAPNCADADGNTPLHLAALAARPIVAALLCDAGAALDAVNREGLTPLGVAGAAANWQLLHFLLERGAKLEVERAQPALLAAAAIAEDDTQGVKLLLKRRARVDVCGALGRTALMTAALHSHARITATLLAAGAKVDLADEHGTTALMEAARAGAPAVVETLAAHKPAPDLIDQTGRTALMIASGSVHAGENTVQRLLALGTSREVRAADGRRAVDFAAAGGRWNIVALLDPHYPRPTHLSAEFTPPAADENSPAHLLDALRFGHWQVVESFDERARSWGAAELAPMFVDLLDHSDPAPRLWLLNHGLDANATSAGVPLLASVLAQLPEALAGVYDLLDAGALAGGGDGVIHVCQTLSVLPADATAEQRSALEALGLSLIERGAEIFSVDAQGRTPLAHAVTSGSIALTQALLARGVDPNAADRYSRTPLFAALGLGEPAALAMLRLLLCAGANPEVRAASGETPLGLILARTQSSLRNWLSWPSWKLPQRALRDTDIVAAAAVGDLAAVDKLQSLGLPLDALDEQGASALLHASGNGHVALVEYLLEHGADAGLLASSGATALSAAVSAQHAGIVDVLLAHGVSVDQRVAGGSTALMIAAALGHTEMVEQLLADGAQVDAQDESGICALHAAARVAFLGRDRESAQRLLGSILARGAAVNARSATGQTALMLLLGACENPGATADQKQLLALLPLLFEHQPDLDVQDQRGVSALHACAMHGLLLPARALLAAGANPRCRDQHERTPREVAQLLGYIDVAAELGSTAAMPAAGTRMPAFGPK